MAKAQLVCSECGGTLSPTDAFCPHCGAKLEAGVAAEPAGVRTCEACGYANLSSASHCESCGARLKGAAAERATVRSRQQARQQVPRKKAFEPWQIVSVVAVIGLLGFLIYTLAANDQPRPGAAPPAAEAAAKPAPPPLEPLEKAAELNPSDPEAALRLANGLHDNGMFERAVVAYKKYLAMRPDDPDARVDMGICSYQLALADSSNAERYFAEAVRDMQTAFQAHPTHQAAAYNLGIVYLHMGNLDESNAWLKRAVALNKNSDLGARAQKILQEHTFTQ